jgi:hypothetical protein
MMARLPVSQETRDALLDTELKYIGARLANVEKSISQISTDAKAYAVIQFDVAALQEKVKNCVTRDQFSPIRNIVYGAVAVILTTVLGAIIALVVTRSP